MNGFLRRAAILPALLLAASQPDAFRAAADRGVPSKTGLVVCTSAPACDAGASILSSGGNAVDAAVATAFALAVTLPAAGNVGGGGFMLVRTPQGALTSFDYRERAPLASTRTMYLRGGRVDPALTSEGYLAPGVPGTVRGLALAHARFGRRPWKDLVMPAVQLAEGGFALSPALARSLNTQLSGPMGRYPASVSAYGKPGGGTWAAGDRLVLPDLARTLRAIADQGPDAFYTGWIADRIAADMAANGGLITRDDLAAYRARERAPVVGTYRGYQIASMGPPSSGGVTLIEMLNILEGFDLRRRSAADVRHLEIEAMRRAYLDRARFLGDPDFVDVPVERLVSKAHADDLRRTIDAAKASRSAELGRDILSRPLPAESDDTTHFSVVDRDGTAVASTYTLEGGYGSRVVVTGTGFLLNNEMGDFNRNPGVTDEAGTIGTPANLIDPGRRMLSSMTPSIVSRDGRVVLVTGSPGGRTIVNTVLAVVLGVTEFHLNVREAVDAPRMDHEWMPDAVRLERADAALVTRLGAMGHRRVTTGGSQGDANSILIDRGGTAWGAADTARSADGKASPADPRLTSTARRQ